MNLQQFTIKAQDTLSKAQQLAIANKHQAMEPTHLLLAMISEDEETLQFIAGKLGANLSRIEQAAQASLQSLPKVEGGQVYLSQPLNAVTVAAEKAMAEMKDEFITNEHLLVGILDGKDGAANILKDAGFKRNDLIKAIQALRGGNRVSSQTDENQFNSLKKFALNLNQMAREGQIGSGDWPRRRNPSRFANPIAPNQKQPCIDWRTRRG
jgi:ATP-dependent Clp protease ATP-binding subunit ClpB